MKKPFQIILLVLSLLIFEKAFSQDKYGENPEMCKEKLSEFYEYARTKDYEYAYQPWLWVFENCPKGSKNIYKYGLLIIEDRYNKSDGDQKEIEAKLIDSIYLKRVEHFPDNLGKVYSDWAIWLEQRGASQDEIFKKLELAFTSDPAQMSIKNLAKYFQEVTDRNKDSDTQLVFDTYDMAMEAISKKMDYHSKALEKETNSESVAAKNHRINLRGLGQIEGLLDSILNEGELGNCDRLIPLYTKGLETHRDNPTWLRRAASRLNAKECTDNKIYTQLVEAYVKVKPSPDAYVFLHFILEKQGRSKEAAESFQKAIDLEQDPYKKAEYLYRLAGSIRKKSKVKSRGYALEALKYRPNFGRAYLLIASLYASSANSCGTDEYSKRMTYVAALDKAERAKAVDPGITSIANRYIKSYMANAPSKKLAFTKGVKAGESYTVKCWINETVKTR